MQPVVAPSRSSHTRSVRARLRSKFSGNGILTDVTRLMALRTSSRSAALAQVSAAATSRHARGRDLTRRRDLIGWDIWETSESAGVRRGDRGSYVLCCALPGADPKLELSTRAEGRQCGQKCRRLAASTSPRATNFSTKTAGAQALRPGASAKNLYSPRYLRATWMPS